MPNTFPTISSGSMKVLDASLPSSMLAMYPSAFVRKLPTKVLTFVDDSEQRWVAGMELFSATLEYHSVNGYDASVVRKFFVDQLGSFVADDLSSTFSITVLGETFLFCCLDQDDFLPREDEGNKYSFTIRVKQLRPNV